MTDVTRLRPRANKPTPLPQCQAKIDTSWYAFAYARENRAAKMKRKGYDPDKCNRTSAVKIDGISYCNQHGGLIAIDILTGQYQRAETINEVNA